MLTNVCGQVTFMVGDHVTGRVHCQERKVTLGVVALGVTASRLQHPIM